MKYPPVINSFNAAIEGFFHVLKTQRNMRIHFIAAVFVLMLGVYLNFTRIEIMILCLSIAFVLATEMLNTVVEFLLDRLITTRDEKTKIIKDVSAGTVLVASINAIIVAYFLFFKHGTFAQFNKAMFSVRQSDWHMTFLAFILVTGVVIFAKVILHKGTPLRGGMPSGHAAISFSICAIISLVSRNPLLFVLSFVLALLVSQSRIRRELHTLWEVMAGAILGSLITVLVFQIFSQVRSI